MNWLTNQLTEVITDYLNSGLTFFTSAIIAIVDNNIELFTASEISAAVSVTTSIAMVLVIILAFKQLWGIYVMESEGNPDQDPLEVIVRVAKVIAIISVNNWLFDTLTALSKNFSTDLVGSCNFTEFSVKFDALLKVIVNPTGSVAMLVLMLVVLLITVVIFAFKSGIRAGELVIMKILFPIFALDQLSAGSERWNNFLESYITTFFGYTIQLFLFRLGLNRSIQGMVSGLSGTASNYFAAFVFFLLAIKIPKWLEKWTYSSGIGAAVSNVGRSAAYMIPSMLRRG